MSYSQHQYEIASQRTGVPVALLRITSGQESGGSQYDAHGRIKTSPKGAQGGMQLMPGTARGLERKYKINTRTPMGNLLGGAYYLAEQKRNFGNWRLALAAYNAGPNAVRQYDGVPPYKETQDYVSHIMQQYRKWAGHPGTRAPASITPGSPASSAVVDPAAFALSSSQDIAQGHYDPIQELQQLHEAMQASAQRANLPAQAGQQHPVEFGPGVKASKKDLAVVNLAMKFRGTPYQWGGTSPGGFDCSGLLQYVWGKKGVKIPRTTYDQINAGVAVKRGQLRPGDAVFFGSASNPHHVGMYIGNGKFIESPHSGAVVRVAKLAGRRDFVTGRRYG